jgi:hypothetical protein
MSSQNCAFVPSYNSRSPFFPFVCEEGMGECVSEDLHDILECPVSSHKEQNYDRDFITYVWKYAPVEMCKV